MLPARILAAVAVLSLTIRPDEGQWLPSQVRAMDWQALKQRGMQITRDQLWHPEAGGLLNAAVQIGGCTAAFVSTSGLTITNHHCGEAAIGSLSTLKQNFLKEGFVAHSLEQELPTGLEMFVVDDIDDVTQRIHAAQERAETPLQRYEYTQAEIQRIVDEAETDPETGQKDPSISGSVASFFEGREYRLYRRTKITDVRLVYAPPIRTAFFGGNVDNWEWPRHAGDFAMFRAYVGPDGAVRPFHRDNVPYQPTHSLHVSTDGISEGDLVLIMGYPGHTDRYLTSVAMQEWQGLRFPRRRAIFEDILRILEDAAAEDPEKALQLNAEIATFANVEKNHLGMVQGLARNAVVDRKIREEGQFTDWARRTQNADALRTLTDLLELDHAEKKTQEKDLILNLLTQPRLRALLPLMSATEDMIRVARDRAEGDDRTDVAELIARLESEDVTRDLDKIQRPLMELLLEECRNLPDGQRIAGSEVLGDADVTSDEMISTLLGTTEMLSPRYRVTLFKSGIQAIEASHDPWVLLMRCMVDEIDSYHERHHTNLGRRMVVGRRWIEAQQAWRGKSFYPDANRTLRISIADVQGYQPRDAVTYGAFTTVAGMLAKNTGRQPFKMPDRLIEAAKRRWLSRFRSAELGDIPVCFLANGDTTNGNSGSPVINGKGELVGLNFDRVFENVACDFGWNADRSRNISLDIRFVLWHLESVMNAPRLLREMGVQ